MSPYQEVPHTADWALRVWAPTRAALFEDAARGMVALAAGDEPGPAEAEPAWRTIEVAAEDDEALLVGWLQELLYATETEGVAFVEFQVEALTATHLRARAAACPAPRPIKAIKAVTYHNLAVQATEEGWEATLVFDV
jgi:SHS2 domain-containing protein